MRSGGGESPETILEHFSAIESLAKVYGAIATALEHPQQIEEYLEAADREREESRRRNPRRIVEKVRRARHERTVQSS